MGSAGGLRKREREEKTDPVLSHGATAAGIAPVRPSTTETCGLRYSPGCGLGAPGRGPRAVINSTAFPSTPRGM